MQQKNYQQSIEHQIRGMNRNGKGSITWAAALKTQFFDRSSWHNFVTCNDLLFPMEPCPCPNSPTTHLPTTHHSWNAKPTECRAIIHLKSNGQQQLLSPVFTFCSQIPPSFNQQLLWELFAASSLFSQQRSIILLDANYSLGGVVFSFHLTISRATKCCIMMLQASAFAISWAAMIDDENILTSSHDQHANRTNLLFFFTPSISSFGFWKRPLLGKEQHTPPWSVVLRISMKNLSQELLLLLVLAVVPLFFPAWMVPVPGFHLTPLLLLLLPPHQKSCSDHVCSISFNPYHHHHYRSDRPTSRRKKGYGKFFIFGNNLRRRRRSNICNAAEFSLSPSSWFMFC